MMEVRPMPCPLRQSLTPSALGFSWVIHPRPSTGGCAKRFGLQGSDGFPVLPTVLGQKPKKGSTVWGSGKPRLLRTQTTDPTWGLPVAKHEDWMKGTLNSGADFPCFPRKATRHGGFIPFSPSRGQSPYVCFRTVALC